MQKDDRELAEQIVKDAIGPKNYERVSKAAPWDSEAAVAWCGEGLVYARQLYAEQVEQAAQSLPFKERNEFFAALRKVQGRGP